MEAYMGLICGWAPNFAPSGWAFCQGQIIGINQNSALFALLGTTYGGNGQTTFGLPNLQGRVAITAGQSGGTSTYVQGQVGGAENVTLNVSQMPIHAHALNAVNAGGAVTDPSGTYLAQPTDPNSGSALPSFVVSGAAVPMASGSIGPAGGNQAFSVLQSYQVIQSIICMQGLFPPRP